MHGVGDDEGGRAGAELRRRDLLAEVRHLAQQTHYVEAAAEEEDMQYYRVVQLDATPEIV